MGWAAWEKVSQRFFCSFWGQEGEREMRVGGEEVATTRGLQQLEEDM